MEYTFQNTVYTTSSLTGVKEFLSFSSKNGKTAISVRLEADDKTIIKDYAITFRMPMKEALGFLNPAHRIDRRIMPDWRKYSVSSQAESGIPVLCVYTAEGKNRATVYLSDFKNTHFLQCGVVEETLELEFLIVLLAGNRNTTNCFETELFINETVELSDCIDDAWEIWGRKTDFSNVPASASAPVYSTWYNYHQHLEQDELLRSIRSAEKLGLKTVIIDDGWQTDDESRKYGFCGEWKVAKKKFYDFEKFVQDVHAIGMKVIVWYSVPFVGFFSESFDRFKDKLLYQREDQNAGVLDPRYKEVRDYLVGVYKTALSTYRLDGFKLDFIDSFYLTDESNSDYENMDFPRLEDAVSALLSEIYSSLKAVNPEVLIEFRQSYFGPATAVCGNMYRVGDCPADRITNLSASVDLRMFLRHGYVHSDPVEFDQNAVFDEAVRHLLSVRFAVPQISLRWDTLPERLKFYLASYLAFYNEHAELLTKGKITVKGIDLGYTQVSSVLCDERATVCYADNVVTVGDEKTQYVFNASTSKKVWIDNENAHDLLLEEVDPSGTVVKNQRTRDGFTVFSLAFENTLRISLL